MTKQEEIKVMLTRIKEKWLSPNGAIVTGRMEPMYPSFEDEVLYYLRSQGVVIKVERGLPAYEKYIRDEYSAHDTEGDIYGKGQAIAMYNMRKAGYVPVEPLIGGVGIKVSGDKLDTLVGDVI